MRAPRTESSAAAVSARSHRPRCPPPRPWHGAFLIEALVALVVVSIATAGLFGLLANAIHASGNALARTEATDIAAATFARMATEDFATLAARYDAHGPGAGFRALRVAAMRLPGVTETDNAPVVSVTPGPGADSQRVVIEVFWQSPGETVRHRAAVTGTIARR